MEHETAKLIAWTIMTAMALFFAFDVFSLEEIRE